MCKIDGFRKNIAQSLYLHRDFLLLLSAVPKWRREKISCSIYEICIIMSIFRVNICLIHTYKCVWIPVNRIHLVGREENEILQILSTLAWGLRNGRMVKLSVELCICKAIGAVQGLDPQNVHFLHQLEDECVRCINIKI